MRRTCFVKREHVFCKADTPCKAIVRLSSELPMSEGLCVALFGALELTLARLDCLPEACVIDRASMGWPCTGVTRMHGSVSD